MYYNLINSMSRGVLGTNFLTNLVAYYSFDGSNATDIHTGTHNGTVVGSPTFPSGKNSNCIDFANNANANYVDIADSTDFSFTNGTTDVPFTISMWINAQALQTGFDKGNWFINKRNTTSGGDEWQLIFFENKLNLWKFQFNNNAITQRIATNINPFSLNTWYHVVYTDDGTGSLTSGKLYINGIDSTASQVNSGGTYTRMNNGTSIVRIGANSWAFNSSLKHRGKLDEVAIWKNRQLSALEVTELYNAGAGKFYNTF